MRESSEVTTALLHFYDRLSAGDVDSFDLLVSPDPATLIIGTAPGEWVRERDQLRFGFETEGVALEPGAQPEGYEEGNLGWAVDEPLFSFPDGSSIRVRLTVVMHRTGDQWQLIHGHFSVGVPDEQVAALQAGWSSGQS
jgi:hypothetical protein